MRACVHCHGRMPPWKRSHAIYCSDRCRARAFRHKAPGTPVYGAERRSSRDGRGVHVYLTPEELWSVMLGMPSTDTRRKFQSAYQKVSE